MFISTRNHLQIGEQVRHSQTLPERKHCQDGSRVEIVVDLYINRFLSACNISGVNDGELQHNASCTTLYPSLEKVQLKFRRPFPHTLQFQQFSCPPLE